MSNLLTFLNLLNTVDFSDASDFSFSLDIQQEKSSKNF